MGIEASRTGTEVWLSAIEVWLLGIEAEREGRRRLGWGWGDVNESSGLGLGSRRLDWGWRDVNDGKM